MTALYSISRQTEKSRTILKEVRFLEWCCYWKFRSSGTR